MIEEVKPVPPENKTDNTRTPFPDAFTTPPEKNKKYALIALAVIAAVVLLLVVGAHIH